MSAFETVLPNGEVSDTLDVCPNEEVVVPNGGGDANSDSADSDYFDDEDELDEFEDPDFATDALLKDQWGRGVDYVGAEEEFIGGFDSGWKTRNYHYNTTCRFNRKPGCKVHLPPESTPLNAFEHLWTDELWQHMVDKTNREYEQWYASVPKKPKSKFSKVTQAEMKTFIGLCIGMGLLVIPFRRDYWRLKKDLFRTTFSKHMSRDRFTIIWRFLKLEDQDTTHMDRGDKMWRMRWFMDYLTSRFQELYEVNGNISVDESMVKFKGRLAFRQYLPNKPIKWGVKLWVLAESTTGYCTGFQVYTGREESSSEGKGLAHRVVMDLARPYYGSHACVYMDNYYTSVELLEEMKTVGLNGCGTVRANRKGLPPLEFLTNGVELDRHEYRVAQKDDLTFCVWQDTKMVMVLSNHHDPTATGTVNRRPEGYKQREALKKQPGFKRVGNRSYQHFKQTEVIVPAALSDYQKHMKGVDLLDQMIGYYGFQHRSKKWWRRVFWFLLGVSCYNAYIAARSSGGPVFKKKYPGYKDWLEDLAGELIHDCTTRSYPVTPPPPPIIPPLSGTSAPRHDFGKIYMKRKLCRECQMLPEHERCGGPTIHGCKQCDQPLHMECMGKHYRRFWYWPSGDNPPAIEASPSKRVRRRLQAEFEGENKKRCKSPRGKSPRRGKSPKSKSSPEREIVRRGPRKPKPLPPPRKSSTRSSARLARARLRIRSDSNSDSDSAASDGNSAAGSDYDPGSPSNSALSPDAPDSPSESLAPPSPSANPDDDVGTVPTSSSTLELPSTSSTSPPSSPAPNPTSESLAVPSPGSNPNVPTSPAPSPPLASVAPASPTIPTTSSSEPSTPQTANPTSNAPLDSLAKPSPRTQNTSATSSSTSTSSSSSTTAPQSTPSATNGHALSPSLEFQARPASRNQPTPVRVHDYSLPEKCDPDRRHTPLPYNLPRMSPATVTACHSIHNYSVNFKEGVDTLNPERATESPFLSPSAIGIAFLPSESTDLQGCPSNSKRGTRTPKKATPRKATPRKTPATPKQVTPRKATPKKATPSKAKGSTASPSAYYSNPPFSPSESMAPPTYPTFSWTSLLSPGSPYSSHGPESPAEPMGPPSPRPFPPYMNSQWGSRSPAYSRSPSPSPSMSRPAPPQNPYYPYTSNPPSESMPPPAPASHSTFPTSSWTSEMHSTPATTPYYTSNPASESTAPPSLGPTFPPNASGPARGGTARRSRKRFKGGDSDRLQARQSTVDEEPQTSSKLQWTACSPPAAPAHPTSSWPSVRPMTPSATPYYSRGSNPPSASQAPRSPGRSDDRHMVYKKFKMTSPATPAQYYSQASNPASESQASTSTSTSGRSPPSTTPQSSNASNTADLAPPSPDSPPTFHVMLPASAFAEDNEDNARFS